MLKKCALILFCGMVVSLLVRSAASLPQKEPVDFVRDVQPIFQKNCFTCHGPDQAMGQLRLDDRRLALKGGISGPVIKPGNPAAGA